MKRRKQSTQTEPEISEGFVTRQASDEQAPSFDSGGKVTLHLTNEGGVDWDRTKADSDKVIDVITKDATLLEKLASHPDFADGEGSTAATDPTAWQPDEAGFVIDLLDKVEGLILSRVSKSVLGMTITANTANLAFSTTEEEHKIQDPRAAQALNDFLTIDNPKWRNVALLSAAHGASFLRKLKEAIKLQEQNPVVEEPPKPIKPNGHAGTTIIEGVTKPEDVAAA